MVSNKYFSTMVRIQNERDHKVAIEGPYKFVRHPGYVGFIVMVIATPIALGSLYALSMSVIVSIIFVIRTSLEDKTLKKELIGYQEYSKIVKYRLIPFIMVKIPSTIAQQQLYTVKTVHSCIEQNRCVGGFPNSSSRALIHRNQKIL